MSKRFQMVNLRGSTQERLASKRFRFAYEKAANDKMVPDRVDSGFFPELGLRLRFRWLL